MIGTELQQPRPRRLGGGMGMGTVIVLAIVLGVFVGRYIIPANGIQGVPFSLSVQEDGQRQFVFPTFWETWDALHGNYIDPLDDKNLFYGAVAGMVQAVGDPYTIFSDPDATKQFRETLDGHFSGVGIEIGVRGGLIRVIAPLEGSPAQVAGVKAGDIIVKVDDLQVTLETTIDEVVRAIRGPRGQAVVLTVARQDGEETSTEEIQIVRDTIVVESVSVERLDGNVAHIKLSSFNGDTTEQFEAIANSLALNRPAGIILDLRNNPGGFLQTAVDIAGSFLNPGTLVVVEKGEDEMQHVTQGAPTLRDIPMVILINEGSASASEILAGALRDQADVQIVGEQSFGKGSVQELIPLKDGSSLRVTVAKWFTPDDISIDDEGITPTVVIEDDSETEDIDEQVQEALKILTQ